MSTRSERDSGWWLGLTWDSADTQSHHRAAHDAALDRLRAMGLLYPCFCTRAEIAASQSAPHGDAGTGLSGTCRTPIPRTMLAAMIRVRSHGGWTWRRRQHWRGR
jgi:glutamyl-Q tRNA(Asp) synthetase